MRIIEKLENWHKTNSGLLVFGLIELGLAYMFVSLAIDSGSLWDYLLTLIFVIGFLRNLFSLIGKLFNGSTTHKSE